MDLEHRWMAHLSRRFAYLNVNNDTMPTTTLRSLIFFFFFYFNISLSSQKIAEVLSLE